MKVLWITNILLPDICDKIGVKTPVVGGWMASSLNALKGNDIKFGVASLYNGDILKDYIINDVHYFLIPAPKNNNKYNISLEKYWDEVNKKFTPNLVHLHGTEYAHGLAFIKSCPDVKVVVSIQGLVSVYHRYFLSDIAIKDICYYSFFDVIRGTSLFSQKKNFKKRGKNEREIIKQVDYVIGRTDWDKTHCLAINSNVNYFFCNETLRPAFYNKKWSYDNCEKYSIFISQAASPIKGLHQVLKALPFLLNKYPNLKVYVGGKNICNANSNLEKIKLSGYGRYVRSLIKKFHLESNIVFLGPLAEEEMVERYLKSNVFVSPSSIENSPNSVGEAQILGVPCISSYVGGVPNMVEDGKTGFLYRFEEVEMLAMLIDKVFSMQEKSLEVLSCNERDVALIRHNPFSNAKKMIEIYHNIINR